MNDNPLKIVDESGNLLNLIGPSRNLGNIYVDWENVIQSFEYGKYILILYLFAANTYPFNKIERVIFEKTTSADIVINKDNDIIDIIKNMYNKYIGTDMDKNLYDELKIKTNEAVQTVTPIKIYTLLSPLLSAVNILKALEVNNILKTVTFIFKNSIVNGTEDDCVNIVIDRLYEILKLYDKNIEYRVELVDDICKYYDSIDVINPIIFTSDINLFKYIIEHPKISSIVFPNNKKILTNDNMYYLMSTVIKDIEFIRYNEVFQENESK